MRSELSLVQGVAWEGVGSGVLSRLHELDLGGFKQPQF